jgi:hypothetical protein
MRNRGAPPTDDVLDRLVRSRHFEFKPGDRKRLEGIAYYLGEALTGLRKLNQSHPPVPSELSAFADAAEATATARSIVATMLEQARAKPAQLRDMAIGELVEVFALRHPEGSFDACVVFVRAELKRAGEALPAPVDRFGNLNPVGRLIARKLRTARRKPVPEGSDNRDLIGTLIAAKLLAVRRKPRPPR